MIRREDSMLPENEACCRRNRSGRTYVRRWHTDPGESLVEIRPPGNGPQYEGTDDRVPHIKRSFPAGAEAFVSPWIDS